MNRPTVSVVIPTLNAGIQFGQLLAALRSQRLSGSVEILVIDSGSCDGSIELARAAGASVTSIPRRFFHHGRTRNHAIQVSRGEFVVMTVQDALPVDDSWLARLLAPLLEFPVVAGSYGLQAAPATAGLLARARSAVWCESRSQASVRSLAAPADFWEMPAEQRLELIRFDDVTSCVRRSVWEQIPFPEHDYGEDMGWAKSVLLAGHQVAFVPAAQVWHCHERTWLYELRRAYVDGIARVLLAGWPSPLLSLGDALAMLRRLLFFLGTRRFDSVPDPDAARRLLRAELHSYEPVAQLGSKPAQAYETALRFCWGLTNAAARLHQGEPFPEKAWIGLLRYALVAVVGQHLGTNSVGALQAPAFERSAWNMLHSILNRNV